MNVNNRMQEEAKKNKKTMTGLSSTKTNILAMKW